MLPIYPHTRLCALTVSGLRAILRSHALPFVIIFLATLVLPAIAVGATQTITATHTYVMGDNDSRNDARRLCFLEAKRKVLEQAGTFIQSSSEVINFQLTRDQMTLYSAAIVSVETVNETFGYKNGQGTITLTVKADVDTEDVKKRLAAIANDGTVQKQIDEQQKKLRLLEDTIGRLGSQIAKTPTSQVSELRKERNVVFSDIAELEKIQIVAKERIDSESDNECEIAEKMKRYVLRGMTPIEVEQILGPPFRKEYSGSIWYYGDSKVFFGEYKGSDKRVSTTFPLLDSLHSRCIPTS
jgi:uncharacterized protein YdhG (YjbR/CyaY superfamily)